MLELVRREQAENPQNKKLVVKIGELLQIRQMLHEAHLCEDPSESVDYVSGKVVEILIRNCLSEARDLARLQNQPGSASASSPNVSETREKKKQSLKLEDRYREAIFFLFTQSQATLSQAQRMKDECLSQHFFGALT